MAFRPNLTGPLVPMGEIAVAAAGTAQPLTLNWTLPGLSPITPTTPGGSVPEYSISFDDIIISSPSTNTGGLYVVTYNYGAGTGGKGNTDTIILFIPKGSPPISLRQLLGMSRFSPFNLAIDVDTNADKAWVVGVI